MARSVFCLCPRGWSPWTLRAYQAMMSGCIPVVIADEIEFPFENTIDWTQLTVKIPEVTNRTLLHDVFCPGVLSASLPLLAQEDDPYNEVIVQCVDKYWKQK
eukprot:443671-Prorocentrum_minimum.AAC.1